MKVNKSSNGTVTVQAEGDTVKAVWKQLAILEEVFCEKQCGKCQGNDLRFVVRNVDDNDFYELHCKNPKCRAKLAFGAHKKGESLFPKRKTEDEETKKEVYLPDNGWQKWDNEKKINY